MDGAVLTTAEMRAADAEAIRRGTPGAELMRRAGEGAADALRRRRPDAPVLVLCGPGSNGGDGFVMARRLAALGAAVRVAATPTAPGASDAAAARAAYPGEVAPLEAISPRPTEVVVDALFGAGLSRSLQGEPRAALERAEAAGSEIYALDLPSGLGGDDGRPLGFAPRAEATFTFHRKKPAHLLASGRALCGEVEVIDIGLADPVGATLFENTPELWADVFPRPATDAHKTRRGHLMVVSGPALRTGAARLAARGGLRSGAGLVTVLTPPGAALVNAAALEAVMVRSVASPEALAEAAGAATAVVIGPGAGVGLETRANVFALKARALALVLDADALTSFKEEPQTLFGRLAAKDVLTPHPGEFSRIFPGLLEESSDRLAAARTAARRAGAVVLLKGPDTIVAAPDGRASINAHASPFLATAGSGDVLAGVLGGLIAQGMETFLAASCAVYLHGDAGLRGGPGLISEDLPEYLRETLRRLYALRNWSLATPL